MEEDNEKGILIKAENITSNNFIEINKEVIPAFSNVSIDLRQGESWVVMSKHINTARIFCATLANILPIKSGKLTIDNKVAVYRKNKFSDDVFYIDSPDMLLEDMNVLEYIMYVNCSSKTKYEERIEIQKAYLDLLIDLGLENIALTQISKLTDGVKFIITILIAVLSNSKIIVVDMNKYRFSITENPRIMQIVDYAKENNKLVIISTNTPEVARISGDHIMYFYESKLVYAGGMSELVDNDGDVVCKFTADAPEKTIEKFKIIANDYEYELIGNIVYVHNKKKIEYNPIEVIELMTKNKVVLKTVNFNIGKLENALLFLDKEANEKFKDINEK